MTTANVNAAAKAAAVVETLDQIAFDARDGFTGARMAIRAGDEATLRSTGYEDEAIAAILAYRSRHNALYDRWRAGQLSPRELRVELVKYYASYGAERLDQRFFSDPE